MTSKLSRKSFTSQLEGSKDREEVRKSLQVCKVSLANTGLPFKKGM